jgi:hypothetical protein
MEPRLTDLIFVDVQEMGLIPPLCVELPQEVALPEVAVCAEPRRSATTKETPGVIVLEKNTLPVVVLGVFCDFLFYSSSLSCLHPR